MARWTTVERSTKPCDCGCGQFTMISPKTRADRGWTKGEPRRFCANHHGPYRLRITYWSQPERIPAKRLAGAPRKGERYVVNSRTGCWEWALNVNDQGYGVCGIPDGAGGTKNTTAHRVAYMEAYGEIPGGHQVHHKCGNRLCVNPEHLEALTPREHGRRHAEQRRERWKAFRMWEEAGAA